MGENGARGGSGKGAPLTGPFDPSPTEGPKVFVWGFFQWFFFNCTEQEAYDAFSGPPRPLITKNALLNVFFFDILGPDDHRGPGVGPIGFWRVSSAG